MDCQSGRQANNLKLYRISFLRILNEVVSIQFENSVGDYLNQNPETISKKQIR
jgi:hypothetical protein